MSLNFPNNPTLNQEYVYNNQTYFWDGFKWVIKTYLFDTYYIDGGSPDSVYLPQDSLDGGAPDSVYQ